MIRRRPSLVPIALALLVTLLAACHGSSPRPPVGVDEERAGRRASADAPVAGWLFASVAEHTLGPFFARRGAGPSAAGMTAWLTPAEGTGRSVHVVPVDAKGLPHDEALVAKVSLDTTMLVLGPVGGSTPGFAVAWTSLTDRGKALWLVTLDDRGTPRSKAIELTRTNDDIVWVDIVPTERGALCLWAEETRSGEANLLAAALNPDGAVRGATARVAQGVTGWHALPVPGGVGVSTVTPAPAAAGTREGRSPVREGKPGGALAFRRLDADGQALAAPVAITPRSATVSGDVEVTRVGGRLTFAWTDRSGEEPAVAMAALGERDEVVAARRVVEARGGAALLGLAGGPSGVAVLFEAPARRTGETRRVHAGRVSDALALEHRPLSLEVVGRGQPELAATASGFAVLATTADCELDAPSCVSAKSVVTVLRTDPHAVVVQREPLTFVADPATLGWGLTCEDDTCFALAASPGNPSRIRTAAVRPHGAARPAAPARSPAAAAAVATGPHVLDVTAVATGETVIDLATLPLEHGSLVALLASRDSRAGRGDDRALTLTTRVVNEKGAPAAPTVLTTQALAIGGVAIAPAATPEEGAAIAWVSRESGDPEVHVTRVDKRGKRLADVQLTTARGNASDVTITWVGGAWIVAWVDWRDGNGEVYAARIGLDLARRSAEERITRAPGDAADLVALAHGGRVWLAWADPRENPREGLADLWVTAIGPKDARRVVEEQRILATAANSRTPALAGLADGVALAWIEDAPLGAETPGASGYGAFLARLGDDGKPRERPARIPLAGEGSATTVALEGAPLRAVVARAGQESLALDAVDLTTSPPAATTLLALDGPPSLDVALALEPGAITFNDEGPTPADRRARRARIAWTR